MVFRIGGQDFNVEDFVNGHSKAEQKQVIIQYEQVDNDTSKVLVSL